MNSMQLVDAVDKVTTLLPVPKKRFSLKSIQHFSSKPFCKNAIEDASMKFHHSHSFFLSLSFHNKIPDQSCTKLTPLDSNVLKAQVTTSLSSTRVTNLDILTYIVQRWTGNRSNQKTWDWSTFGSFQCILSVSVDLKHIN